MANKQMKKIRQAYRRDLRDELQHVETVRRDEAQILVDHLKLCEKRKPKYMPKKLWSWIIKKTLYRK